MNTREIGFRSLLPLAAAVFLWPAAASAEVNATVKALMQLIVPAQATPDAKPGDFKALQQRTIAILEFLERHEGAGGKRAQHLLINAFYIYRRDRFSGHRRMMTEGAIMRNWEKARELGLFNKVGKIEMRIREGREKGKTASFEYIIPAGNFPAFSNDLANVRIVTPATKRTKGAGLSARDEAYRSQLKNIEQEVLYGRPDELGRTRRDNLILWKADVERAGDEFNKNPPGMSLSGKVTATPSSLSENRWRVSFEAANLSRVPAQVKAEYYIFGISEQNNNVYLLGRKNEELKLRSSERRAIDVFSDPRTQPMNMRGWLIRVLHNGKEIEWKASGAGIYDHLKNVGGLPRMKQAKKGKKK